MINQTQYLTLRSHDNTRFASCGGDKSVFLWDVTAGATIRRFAGHFQRVNCVAFNQESTVVASGSYDSTVRLWDCKSQNRLPLQLLEDATDSITALQIQNAEVITASVDGHVRIYDLRMGQLKQDYIGQPVVSITCSKDGATYLATTLDSTHRLMDKDDGHMLQVFKGHKNTDYRLHSTLSRDDAYVVSGSEDGSLVIWDVLTGDIKSTIPTAHGLRKSSDGTLKPNVITWVECHPSSEQMLSAGTDGSIRVYK